ncbi:hypothetical protein HD806DRAFT_302841 [Xylariaceae sp. AK1471]|nr:hypothetical protein HD806DRAFT_302841 [Xylariaceae sp. AK1471]
MSGINYRTGQNLCSPTCPVEHIDIPSNRIRKPANGWPSIGGLHSLQYSRDTWLNDEAILVANKVYHSSLPKDVRDQIDITQPGIDARVFYSGRTGVDALYNVLKGPLTRMYKTIKAKEYNIWPINTNGNHWVTVIIHKKQRPDKDNGNKQAWTHITEMAVVDPYRSGATMNMVHTQIRKLLEAGKFTFALDYERKVWSSLQRDASSCGPRSYWCAKQFMDRILWLYESKSSYNENLWDDLSGWFDEDFVRGEMIGRAAWNAIRDMNYNARVAIECVNRVRKHDAISDKWKNAGQLMRPPKNRNEKPETRPQATEPSNVNSNSAGGGPWPAPPYMKPESLQNHKPDTAKNTGPDFNTPNNPIVIDDDSPPRPSKMRGPWLAPVPIPNRHRVAPNAPPGENDIAVIDDDDEQADKQKGPAWPAAPRGDNPFIPPPRIPSESRPALRFKNAGGGTGFGKHSYTPAGKRSFSPGPDPDQENPKKKKKTKWTTLF